MTPTIDITELVDSLFDHIEEWSDAKAAEGFDEETMKAAVIAVGRIAAMSEGMTLDGDMLQ